MTTEDMNELIKYHFSQLIDGYRPTEMDIERSQMTTAMFYKKLAENYESSKYRNKLIRLYRFKSEFMSQIENDKRFDVIEYNNEDVVIDTLTGYFNATIYCRDHGIDFGTIITNSYWRNLFEKMHSNESFDDLIIDMTIGVNPELMGIYVDESIFVHLVEFVSIYSCIEMEMKNSLQATIPSIDTSQETIPAIIKDLTTPINHLNQSSIYAYKLSDSYFQLKYSREPMTPRKNVLKIVEYVNAEDVKREAMKYFKRICKTEKYGRYEVFDINDLDDVFETLDMIKHNKIITLAEDKQEYLDKRMSQIKRDEARFEGFKFEYMICKERTELIPWKLIPISIINKYNESYSDTGIDAVAIDDDRITEIIQIKNFHNTELLLKDLSAFIRKCKQKRYENVQKRLIANNCLISQDIREICSELDILIEELSVDAS